MKKPVFYTEIAYAIGLLLLAWGTALTAWGGYGVSMVVAPAYILFSALSQALPWFTFGMAEYILQALILAVMMLLLRKVRLPYFLSFATAILYGLLLDAGVALCRLCLPAVPLEWQSTLAYVSGDFAICAGVALMFRTYLPPEAYEMFVKELAPRLDLKLYIFKTVYDCSSLLLAVIMSFALFGSLQNIGIGTICCAFVNGIFIKMFSMLFERTWEFRDLLPFRCKFEESDESL